MIDCVLLNHLQHGMTSVLLQPARLLQRTWNACRSHRARTVSVAAAETMTSSPSILSNLQEGLLQQLGSRSPVICYHYPCPDGIFAALAAHLHYKQRQPAATPRFRPLTVYDPVSAADLGIHEDDVVFFLDYTGPAGLVQQAAARCNSVVVLDHHKTALEHLSDLDSLPSNVHLLLDMGRSGATLARDFFQPQLNTALDTIYRYVEDADLWRWQVPHSRAFHAGLSGLSIDYSAGSPAAAEAVFTTLQQLDPAAVVAQGEEVLKRQQQAIEEAIAGAAVLQLGGSQGVTQGWPRCLGCVVTGDLIGWRSSLGNQLAEASKTRSLAPVGVVAYVEPGMADQASSIKVSLRAVDGFDTTCVTQAYGGGGHRAASSCLMPREQFQAWQVGQQQGAGS